MLSNPLSAEPCDDTSNGMQTLGITNTDGDCVQLDELFTVGIEFDHDFVIYFPCHADAVVDVMGLCSDLNVRFLEAFESDSQYHVVYSSENFADLEEYENVADPSTTLAFTRQHLICVTGDCTAEIVFNEMNFGTISDIKLAAAIIHENTHALLRYLLNTNQISTNNNNPDYTDLAIAYCQELAQLNNPSADQEELADFSHATMVNIIDEMTDALMEYATNREVSITEEYAKKIMYSGTLTVLDNYTTDFSPDFRNEITALNHAERTAQDVTITNSSDITTTYEQQGFPFSLSAPCD